MNDGLLTILILGAELGAVILLVFIIFIIMRFKRRNADKTYVHDFIRGYNESKTVHDMDIRKRLEMGCNDADQTMNMITTSEKKLFKHVLNMYLGNDRHCLSDIQKDVEVLNDNWLSVVEEVSTNAVATVSNDENIEELEGKISELEGKNHEISDKFGEAMRTMEEIMVEYARLYAGRDEKDEKMEKLSDKYDKLKDTHNAE